MSKDTDEIKVDTEKNENNTTREIKKQEKNDRTVKEKSDRTVKEKNDRTVKSDYSLNNDNNTSKIETSTLDPDEIEVEDDNTKEKKKDNKDNMRTLIHLLEGFIVGILVGWAIFTITLNKSTETVDKKDSSQIEESTETSDKTITTYSEGELIKDKKKVSEFTRDLSKYAKDIASNNSYVQLKTGENVYMYYLYNKNGEIFSQDSDNQNVEVFLNTDKVFKYSDSEGALSVGKDIDIASMIENAAKAVDDEIKGVNVYYLKAKDSKSTDEYRIDLVGEDAIKSLYSSLSSDFAEDMLSNMKDTVGKEENNWQPHMIIAAHIDKNPEKSYIYCLYVVNSTEYTNWFLMGYGYTDDWKLEDAWYDYDPKSDKSGDKYSELASNLMIQVNKVVTKYAKENGLTKVDETSSTESGSQESNK